MWFFSNPTGTVQASGSDPDGNFDLSKDLWLQLVLDIYRQGGLEVYSQESPVSGRVAIQSDPHSGADRTIDFQGQTFEVGLTTTAKLSNWAYAPGYQYDIIRRDRGHLGLAVQLDFSIQPPSSVLQLR